jgi:hypothetical protein
MLTNFYPAKSRATTARAVLFGVREKGTSPDEQAPGHLSVKEEYKVDES